MAATKTSPSRRVSSSRASKRDAAPGSPPRARPRSAAARSAQAAAEDAGPRQILSPHARDAAGHRSWWSLGSSRVLGIWFDAAGPVGRLPHVAARAARSASPRTCSRWSASYWGVVLLRDIAREDRVRMFIGFCVLGRSARSGRSRSSADEPGADRRLRRRGGRRRLRRRGGRVPALPRALRRSAPRSCVSGSPCSACSIFTGTPIAARLERARRDFFTRRRSRTPEPRTSPSVRAPDEPDAEPTAAPKQHGSRRLREALGLVEPAYDEVVVVPDGPGDDLESARGGRGGRAAREHRPPGPRAAGPSRRSSGPYQLPPLDLLRAAPPSNADARDEAEHADGARATLTRSASTRACRPRTAVRP